MDTAVLDAIKRWPNVPAAWGWLSLTCRGQWRLHPLGDAARGEPGESITNTQITHFISRNYVCDDQGRWLFQNGPQKVYVRLDSTPYIAHVQTPFQLILHTGHVISMIDAWFADPQGHVYMSTEHGLARIDDRDLIRLTAVLQTERGQTLDDIWPCLAHAKGLFETHHRLSLVLPFDSSAYDALSEPRRLYIVDSVDTLANHFHFVRNPIASA